MLEIINKGKRQMPPRVVVYGHEGLGKSTFAANSPKPIFIPTEDGLGNIECDSFPLIRSYSEYNQCIAALANEEHDYKTVVLDSADWLEPQLIASETRRQGVQKLSQLGGGYGREFDAMAAVWREVCASLDYLRQSKGMGVIVISHAKVDHVKDPLTDSYDRYSLNLCHAKCAAVLIEWADAVLFATKKYRLQEDSVNGTRKIAKAVGDNGGERVLWTVSSPACMAKNRYGMPEEIALSWAEFEKYI